MFRAIINNIHFGIIVTLLMLLFAAITYVSARFSNSWLRITEDTSEIKITNTLMGIMASGFFVLMAFIIINTWNYQQEARNAASKEATYLSVILRNAEVFSAEEQKIITTAVADYTVRVRVDEWRSMQQGMESKDARASLDRLNEVIQNLKPSSYQDKLYHGLMTVDFENLLQARRDRLGKIDSIIPKSLINTVFIYSVFLAFIVGIIRGRDNLINLTPVLLFSSLLGLNLALAISFDYPFSGEISVTNKNFYEGSLGKFPDEEPVVP